MVFDPENAAILARVEVVTTLGEGTDEAHRIGKVTVGLNRPLLIGNDYELYYQDTFGSWYLTKFHVGKLEIDCAFPGVVARVPPEVEAQGRVAVQ